MFFKRKNSPQGFESLEDFKKIYDEHNDFIRVSVYWLIRDGAVDDIVQETFIKAWTGRNSFQHQSSVKTWLYRIARNCALDYLRKERTYREEPLEDGVSSSFQTSSEEIELKDLITKGLLKLSNEEREVLTLHYKMGQTMEEIAELIGIPTGTVKSRLSKARHEFKYFLEKQEVDYVG